MWLSPAMPPWQGDAPPRVDDHAGCGEILVTMKRYTLAATILAGACLAGAASAQQAGTYSGTATDGTNISFTIGTDSATGALQVTAVGIGLSDTCNPGAFTYNTGWGLGGDGTDLNGSKGTYTSSFGYLYVAATLSFSGTTLKGTVENATPTFVAPTSGTGEPKKAAYCSSKKQTYTATLQTSGDTQAASRPHAVFYGGTVVRR